MGAKKLTIFIILIGSITWSLVMVRSGLMYEYGLGFWGPNGHDGIWHLSIIESLAKGSVKMPIFAGEGLKNYHIGFDIFVAVLHALTKIPVKYLYFQIVPIFFSLAIGILSYIYIKNWRGRASANWSLFFIYFGGSLGWLVSFIRNDTFYGESMFWSQQAISTLINPPYAMSLIFLLLGLIFYQSYLNSERIISAWVAILCFSLLLSIKAYAGVLLLLSLFLYSLYRYFVNRKFSDFYIFFASLILSLVLFLPLNKNSSGLLIVKPFWFLETMMGLSDRFGWQRYFEAMTAYKSGSIYVKFIPAYLGAFIIFILGNFSTRLIGLLYLCKFKVKNYGMEGMTMVLIILGGIMAPMIFLQQGTAWNTIQFFYYAQYFMAILAGIVLSDINKKLPHKIAFLFSTLIIFVTIPTCIATLKYHYLTNTPPAALPKEEFEALRFLAKMPDGVVLTYPYDPLVKDDMDPPVPLYAYVSSAYVSAFSKKTVFLEDEVNLTITGYDWKNRREVVEGWLNSNDHEYVYSFLRANNISYIYWVRGQRAVLGETQLGIEEIFKNSRVSIYEIK